LTGLAGLNFFFKKSNDVVLIKNKSQRVATRFLTGSCWVARLTRLYKVFSYFFFFSIRLDSSPGSAGFWIDPLNRIEFQNYECYHQLSSRGVTDHRLGITHHAINDVDAGRESGCLHRCFSSTAGNGSLHRPLYIARNS
jgi:hypothetical protein